MKTFLIIVGVIVLIISFFILYLFISSWLDDKKKEKKIIRELRARKKPILGIVVFSQMLEIRPPKGKQPRRKPNIGYKLIVAVDEKTLHEEQATPISLKNAGSKYGYSKFQIESAWQQMLKDFPKGGKYRYVH